MLPALSPIEGWPKGAPYTVVLDPVFKFLGKVIFLTVLEHAHQCNSGVWVTGGEMLSDKGITATSSFECVFLDSREPTSVDCTRKTSIFRGFQSMYFKKSQKLCGTSNQGHR
jgi:hypothetical protein